MELTSDEYETYLAYRNRLEDAVKAVAINKFLETHRCTQYHVEIEGSYGDDEGHEWEVGIYKDATESERFKIIKVHIREVIK